MGRYQIEEKSNTFLKEHDPFRGECDVVYLLIEIRKILDHENNNKYPILRFYSDWAVHTEKDKITKEIKKVMEDIYKEIITHIENKAQGTKNQKIIGFADFKELRVEVDTFLKDHSLPGNLVIEKEGWPIFKGFLAKVLEDQPINDPCIGIQKYSLVPANEGCVLGEIVFEKKPAEYDIFKFGGAY